LHSKLSNQVQINYAVLSAFLLATKAGMIYDTRATERYAHDIFDSFF